MTRNFTPFPELMTARLHLRELRNDDAPEVLVLRSDDEVNRYIDRAPALTLANARNFIDRIRHGVSTDHWLYWAVTVKDAGKLIGTVSLWNFDPDEGSGALGYELLPGEQGRGYMQEAVSAVIAYAFGEIRLNAIRAVTRDENQPSVRLLLKQRFLPHHDTSANAGESGYRLTRERWLQRR